MTPQWNKGDELGSTGQHQMSDHYGHNQRWALDWKEGRSHSLSNMLVNIIKSITFLSKYVRTLLSAGEMFLGML